MVKTIKETKASTVVWAAGAGAGNPDRTKAVDNEGAIRSMDATAKAGVKRYIIISALDVRDRDRPKPAWYNDDDLDRSNKVWKAIGVCSRSVCNRGMFGLKHYFTAIHGGQVHCRPQFGHGEFEERIAVHDCAAGWFV